MTDTSIDTSPAVDDHPGGAGADPVDAVASGGTWRRGWVAIAVALLAVPWLDLIVPALGRSGVGSTYGDVASTEVAVQNALQLHQSLGPYDRFGWFHPGPMLFYLLAPPYAALGHSAIGLAVGTCVINLLSSAAIVVLVARRAGSAAALAASGILIAFMLMLPLQDMRDAWSPLVITLPAALFVVLCVDAACGGRWTALGAVVVGSFLVQTEIGLGPVTAVALVAAGVLRLLTRPRLLHGLITARNLIVAGAGVVVLAIIWAPPLVQEFTDHHGNISAIIDFFTGPPGHHSSTEILNLLANGLVVGLGPRILPALTAPVGGHLWQLWTLLALVVVFTAVCVVRRRLFGILLGGGAILLTAVYAFSLSRARGEIGGYLVVWTRGLTVCGALGAIVAVAPSDNIAAATDRRWLRGSALVAMAAIVAFASGRETATTDRMPLGENFGTIRVASAAISQVVPRDRRGVLVCILTPAAWAPSAGVVAFLRRSDWTVHVGQPWLHTFGSELAPTGRERETLLMDIHGPSRLWPLAPARIISAGGLDVAELLPAPTKPTPPCPPSPS